MPSDLLECKRGRERATAHRPLTHPVRVTERRAVMQPSNTPEEWRPVVGYEGHYEVSDHGRVRSLDRTVPHSGYGQIKLRGKVRKQVPSKSGHLVVCLNMEGVKRFVQVHRAVLLAFVGPPPEGSICCHNDGDPSNNRLSNLRWGDFSANQFDAVDHGHHHQTKKDRCPRGHRYVPENIMPSAAKKGHRSCLACNRAHAALGKGGYSSEHFAHVADGHYARIVSGADQ